MPKNQNDEILLKDPETGNWNILEQWLQNSGGNQNFQSRILYPSMLLMNVRLE